jgi:hypothetical protein
MEIDETNAEVETEFPPTRFPLLIPSPAARGWRYGAG